MADNKIIGEILIPIEPPGPERPAPKELVVKPEPDAEVEIAEGNATLSAPDAETGTYVVHLRPRGNEDA